MASATDPSFAPVIAAPVCTTQAVFTCLTPDLTAEVYATNTPSVAGVAFASNGDPVMESGRAYRADSTTSSLVHGSHVHPVSSVAGPGCLGITNGADGKLYTADGSGVHQLDPTTLTPTGLVQGAGGPGCYGMSTNPVTHEIHYTDYSSGVAKVSADLSTGSRFSTHGGDGIAWDPTGKFLFLALNGGVTVLDTSGNQVNFVSGGTHSTDGIAFHADAPRYVLTDDPDGTLTRFDFPGDDYTKTPVVTTVANGGGYGDISGVGPDGCLYFTQSQTRFADGTVTGAGSLARVCGGFAPPAGLGAKFTAVEGNAYSGTVATFVKADSTATAADFTATVDWGDGTASSAGAVSADPSAPNQYTVTGTHTYAEEQPKVVVTVIVTDTRNHTQLAKIQSTGAVADAPLTEVTAGDLNVPTTGHLTGVIGSFTDANPAATAGELTASTTYGDGSAAEPTTVSAATGGFTVSGTHDYAAPGNYTASTLVSDSGGATVTLTRKVVVASDSTPPVVVGSVNPPTPDHNGWYNTGTPVVTFSVTDPESAITDQSAGCAGGSVNADTVAQTWNCSATSAGGTASASVTVKRDATAPTVVSPGDSTTWSRATSITSALFTASDATSGIDDADKSFSLTATAESTKVGGTVVPTTVTRTVTDAAGNDSTATFKALIDRTSPTVSLVGGPANGSTYWTTTVAAPSCNGSDALSGLASCTVTGFAATPGSHTVTATATDNAGNTSTATSTYTVRRMTSSGYYQPVDMSGVFNVVKNGSTVPLKFNVLIDGVQQTSTSVVTGFTATKISCDLSAASDPDDLVTTGATALRYDSTAGQFIQNWKTPTGAGTCYRTTATLQDGSGISALFKLK